MEGGTSESLSGGFGIFHTSIWFVGCWWFSRDAGMLNEAHSGRWERQLMGFMVRDSVSILSAGVHTQKCVRRWNAFALQKTCRPTPHWGQPISCISLAAAPRVSTFSLRRMFSTCLLAVRTLIESIRAIASSVLPSDNQNSTSASRFVSPSF